MNNLTDEEKIAITDISQMTSLLLISELIKLCGMNFKKFKLCMDFALDEMTTAHEYASNKNFN